MRETQTSRLFSVLSRKYCPCPDSFTSPQSTLAYLKIKLKFKWQNFDTMVNNFIVGNGNVKMVKIARSISSLFPETISKRHWIQNFVLQKSWTNTDKKEV